MVGLLSLAGLFECNLYPLQCAPYSIDTYDDSATAASHLLQLFQHGIRILDNQFCQNLDVWARQVLQLHHHQEAIGSNRLFHDVF